jgi:hypothetical protein
MHGPNARAQRRTTAALRLLLRVRWSTKLDLGPSPSDGIQRQVTVVGLLENDLMSMSLFRMQNHRITFVVRNIIDSGIVSPSAFAVFRLTATSNTVGCSMGSSPGLAPLRILSTK